MSTTTKTALFSTERFRRFFSGRDNAMELERRVLNLPVAVERRGPRCNACGFGTMHLVPVGQAEAGRLRCNRVGCELVCDAPAKRPDFAAQPAFARG
jgi:hypothetical protein